MKIRAITSASINGYHIDLKNKAESGKNCLAQNITNLDGIPYYYPINFTAIQNSSKLRMLFAHKLPCMYSGIPMMDPKLLNKWMKSNLFSRPSSEVINVLSQNEESFSGIEAQIYQILKERSKIHPQKNIKELLEEIKPVYSRRLRKKQTPIFKELHEIFQELPSKYQYKFALLMQNTEKKLNEKPVVIPFSSYEFKYKLTKIKDDLSNSPNIKAKKVLNKLLKESNRFSNVTNTNTIETQKKVLRFMEIILKKSVLKDNLALKNLIEVSKSRLNKDEIVVSFTRKTFIYDLLKIVEDLHDDKIVERIITTAQKLPTSRESTSAYIMKITSETPDKIGHRLIWPSLASVEHIHPKSCGGADDLANFGGATTRENSDRKNIDFVTQLKRRPDTPKHCQAYVDKLIELYKDGTFYKYGISPKYITDFANAIYNESQHLVKLDTSKLY